ncbi:dihydrofolate reductase [Aestuariivivens sediminis]|uniref:dihydrofolate reductase n=1 Tax=Aestuariivivens sediminis TaxID=2913557 RepID=UPI001F5972F9|nr:dihydrofolate reductase [Aestuariivivens sediminis]
MFGKKKDVPEIDKDQLELIENAQKRIRQKKRLYIHFVIFLIGSVLLIIGNIILGIGQEYTLFGKDWFLYAILLWGFFLLYHVFNVFVTHKFMGKAWEKQQLEKLIAKQQQRLEQLNKTLKTEEPKTSENSRTKANKPSGKPSEITIIAAVAENNAIGKNNQLIWHLSDDLKRFKALTNGHHIIMGRKTFESFPRPLPNRTHIVITKQDHYSAPADVIVVNTLEDALDAAKNDPQPFIIGGGEIYKQAMPIADRIELTRVHEKFDADTFFPDIETTQWKEMAHSLHEKDENNDYKFSFITYKRI